METFLWFLDDGERGGWNLSDTLEAIQSPDATARCLAVGQDKDPNALSVRGLMEFVEFCTAFDEFLRSIKENGEDSDHVALLRSVYWHYHSYWFTQLGDKIDEVILKTAIPYVVSWRTSVMNDPEAPAMGVLDWESIDTSLEASSAAVRRLVDRKTYGDPLQKAMRQ